MRIWWKLLHLKRRKNGLKAALQKFLVLTQTPSRFGSRIGSCKFVWFVFGLRPDHRLSSCSNFIVRGSLGAVCCCHLVDYIWVRLQLWFCLLCSLLNFKISFGAIYFYCLLMYMSACWDFRWWSPNWSFIFPVSSITSLYIIVACVRIE